MKAKIERWLDWAMLVPVLMALYLLKVLIFPLRVVADIFERKGRK